MTHPLTPLASALAAARRALRVDRCLGCDQLFLATHKDALEQLLKKLNPG